MKEVLVFRTVNENLKSEEKLSSPMRASKGWVKAGETSTI